MQVGDLRRVLLRENPGATSSHSEKMFWRMAGLCTTSPVESLLDKDVFTLEELLDEDELIQECKSLNARLINFLRGKSQIQQLVRYVVEEPPEGADNKRAFKFPFIACEIFTCEIEVIVKTMVEDEELMGLLFSFLDSDHPHGALLAGYFSKVVICLLLRKTAAMMRYLQVHQDIFKKLVDHVAIRSIMEVLVRLIGADDSIHGFHEDSLHWLADTNLLEMLLDKLRPPNSCEAHVNAAEALSAVSRLSQSALATRLSSPSFIARLFHHALEDPNSKTTLVHSLSVCISLLDPKQYVLIGMSRGQHTMDSIPMVRPETIEGMLQRLGDLLELLNVSADERVLPTTYGELRPPLGTHRLKIVEFIGVLLRTNNEEATQKLVQLNAIQIVLNLFFEYPFNNMLHHHVETMVISCIESSSKMLMDHIFLECDFVARLLKTDKNPFVSKEASKHIVSIPGKAPPRIGNIGHLTRIANQILQAANNNADIHAHLQGNPEWIEWQSNVLQSRNSIDNVCQWTCGRPTSIRDRPVDSDEDDFRDKDYDISTMASNLTREVFRYGMFNNDTDEGLGVNERDDDDVFFDDESAEVVISSLTLGEEHESGRLKESFLSGQNWFAFSNDRSNQSMGSFLVSASHPEDTDSNNNISSSNSSSSDDEVVVGEDDERVDTASSSNNAFFIAKYKVGSGEGVNENGLEMGVVKLESGDKSMDNLFLGVENLGVSDASSIFQGEKVDTALFSARPPDWGSWRESLSSEGTSGGTAFSDNHPCTDDTENKSKAAVGISSSMSAHEAEGEVDTGLMVDMTSASTPREHKHDDTGGDQTSAPLFGGTVQFVGVEIEGTAKAMKHAQWKGTVGEAGPIHPVKHVSQNEADSEENDFSRRP